MSAPELLPCPFCGSAKVSQSLGKTGDGRDWPYIECEECGSSSEPDGWNKRSVGSSAPVEAGGSIPNNSSSARQPGQDAAGDGTGSLAALTPHPARAALERILKLAAAQKPYTDTSKSDLADQLDAIFGVAKNALSEDMTK